MTRWFLVAALLTACSGSTTPVTEEPTTPEVAPKADPTPAEMPPMDKEQLQKTAESTALVPSPVETQRALAAAGVETQLATLIPKHTFNLGGGDMEHAAVRTGVVLADMLLTVKTAEKADLIARLQAVQTGMKQLEGGSDIERVLEGYIESVTADSMSRDELLKEFDELSGAVIPELEFNGKARVVPLIQAGSWLEGANLVARAVKAKNTPAAADGMLKQPAVVKHFRQYVTTESSTPPQVVKTLEESLVTLEALATKATPLDDADIDTVITSTSSVLALL